MFSLFPKNEIFFDLLSQATSNMHRTAQLFLELLKTPSRSKELLGAIREAEHQGDRLTRDTIHLLVLSFITPLDREDIHSLITAVDTVIDNIDEAAAIFAALSNGAAREECIEQGEYLLQATEQLADIVAKLRFRKLDPRAQLQKVYDAESNADAVHSKALERLYRVEKDAVSILRWKEVIEHIEKGVDACQDTANTLDVISIKAFS